MGKQGIEGSRTAVWRFFKRHDVSFKKTLYASEQNRADVARARRRWIRQQHLLDCTALVFLAPSHQVKIGREFSTIFPSNCGYRV